MTFLAVATLLAACGRNPKEPQAAGPLSPATALIRKALPAFEAARGRRWPAPSPRVVRLREALKNRNGRLARTLAEEELRAHPDSLEAILVRSQLLFMSAAMAAARPGFERILEQGPSFEGCQRVFYLYGSCLARLGEGNPAREALRAHLRLDPKHGETHYSLGELTLQEGDPEGSLPHFQRALELFRTSRRKQGSRRMLDMARVHASIASAHFQAGALDAARQSIGTSLKLNPNHPQSHYTLSRILSRLGDVDGASTALINFKRLNQPRGKGGSRK